MAFVYKILSVIKNNKYLIFLCSLLLIMCLILYRNFIFGGKLFLFEDFGSDSVRVVLPTYLYFFEWFKSGMPMWSDQMGIGTSVLSHGDIIFDPFTYMSFIFGKNGIIYMFVYVIIAKIVFSGIFFWLFLGKYKLSPYAKLIGAVVYAFGGYMIVVGQNYVFGTIYVYLSLILLGFEMWLQDKKKWLLILMLSLTALYFFYFFYMTAIFLAIYAVFRYFTLYRFRLRHFINYTSLIMCYGLLSLGLTAFYWLPFLVMTLNNLRVGSSLLNIQGLLLPPFSVVITALGRLFNYDIFGNPETYAGFNRDYFQLALFSGVISMVLIPQIFSEENKRKRNGYIFFFITLLTLLAIPLFSYIFNGFSDFTYRWTYVLHFSIALFLALAINSVFARKILNYKILFITVVGLIVASLIVAFILGLMGTNPGFSFRTKTEASQVLFSISQLPQHTDIFGSALSRAFRMLLKDYLLIFAYAALAVLFIRTKYRKFIKILVLVLLCLELIWLPKHFINNRITTNPDPIKSRTGYFDNTENAVRYLKGIDGNVYRIDKSYDSVISEYGRTPSNNEAMVQGYRGIKSYNANNQPSYVRFLQDAGIFVKYPGYIPLKETKPQEIVDANLNYINGVGDRFLLQSFLGVKYYLTKNSISLPDYYHYLTTVDGIKIYDNKNALPLGFTFDSYVTKDKFMKLSNADKDLVLLSHVVIDNQEVLDHVANKNKNPREHLSIENDVNILVAERKKDDFKLISYKEDYVKVKVTVKKSKVLVLTIPYDEGWTVFVDNQKITFLKVDNGLIGIILNSGSHVIELQYFPPKMILGSIVSIFSLVLLIIFNRIYIKKMLVKLKKVAGSLYINHILSNRRIVYNIFSKMDRRKEIFYLTTTSGILLFLLGGFITRGQSFYNLFIQDKFNSFMDFFNLLYLMVHGAYAQDSFYPPLPLLMYRILLRFIPYDVAEKGSNWIRANQSGEMIFLLYILVSLFMFFILILQIKKGSAIEKYIFTFVILFSGPFLFQFERANIIFVALLFLMIFVFFKNSKNRIVREIALISLAISAGIKIYPVLFGLLLVKERRFKESVRLLIYSVSFSILPLFMLGGISQLPIMFKNFLSTSNIAREWGIGYAVNIQAITRIMFGFFGDFGQNPIIIGMALSFLMLVLGLMVVFILHSEWKTIALITLLMILVPTISYVYVLIFMVIPLIMFLDRKEKGKQIDYLYLACFILIFIPFTFGKVDIINNGFDKNISLPLTYGVLIQNIALTIMMSTIIIEGIRRRL